jgi:hypothetical protein
LVILIVFAKVTILVTLKLSVGVDGQMYFVAQTSTKLILNKKNYKMLLVFKWGRGNDERILRKGI